MLPFLSLVGRKNSNAPQGVLQCWVDVMPPGDAKGFVPADVALPPEAEFEVGFCVLRSVMGKRGRGALMPCKAVAVCRSSK